MAASHLHIGTSGWHYKHWKGGYYPEHLKPEQWLAFYARDYDSAEINNSFYRLPDPEVVLGWAKKVPARFRFCPKMSRYLSHMKKLNDPEEPLERFFSVFDPIRKKLGPVLIQLPKMVRFKKDLTEHFYRLLSTVYADHEFAMEVRHESWLEKQSLDLMRDHNIALVISQSGADWPYREELTARHVYFRFHGPAALYASSYSDEILKDYAAKFRRWMKKGHDLWIFFNNDINLHAIHNAASLKKMMHV